MPDWFGGYKLNNAGQKNNRSHERTWQWSPLSRAQTALTQTLYTQHLSSYPMTMDNLNANMMMVKNFMIPKIMTYIQTTHQANQ